MSTSNIKAIDLGLSVKWADCNLGATNETDCGYYFSWGSITPGTKFYESDCRWYNASTGKYTVPVVPNIGGTSDDAATVILGNKWRTPNDNAIGELIAKCTWVATDNGFRVIGPNKNEIFLPFTGMYMDNNLISQDKMFYWSSQYDDLPVHENDHWAWHLTNYINNEGENLPTSIGNYIYKGMCIRPIMFSDDNSGIPDTPPKEREAIDLGLSVKWANMNIKSKSNFTDDAFFSWGSTFEQVKYDSESYPYSHKDISENGNLPVDKDAARQNWGDKWRMPTINEWNELINSCKWTKTIKNGITGYNVTGNGNTIFIPLSGQYNGDEIYFKSHQALYWTSECKTDSVNNFTDAYGAFITVDSEPYYFVSGSNDRYMGNLIRPVYDNSITPITPDDSDTDNTTGYDSEDRQKLINEYSIYFKSNHYKKFVFDFSKPWDLYKTQSEAEFMTHMNDATFLKENADFEHTHFDEPISVNYWKGNTECLWSNYLKSFILAFYSGGGFTVKANATNGWFLTAVDFGTRFDQAPDLMTEQNRGIRSRMKTLWLTGTSASEEIKFYYNPDGMFDLNGISKVTLYGFNLDEVPSPGSTADYGRYDQIEAKGYKEAIFNFMRPKTLSLFTNTPDDEILYSSLERKTLRNGVASIYFDQNPQYDGTNNHITAQLLVSYRDWGGLFTLSGDGDVPGASLSITGRFTISVEQGYEIKSIVFEGETYGFTLYYDGKTIPNNTEDFEGNTSLPICPIDHNDEIWVANKKGLTSVSFVHFSSMSTIDILAVYVGYVKVGEKVTPPTPSLPGDSEDKTDTNIKGDVVHIPDTPSTPDTSDIPDDDNDNISKDALVFTDTGDTGYSVDPNVILYAGGQEVIPKTMAQKDNTLFLGNYKESSRVFSQEMADFIKANSKVEFTLDMVPKIPKGETGSLYMYENQLNKNSYDIASFKGGEAYRFGVVFQNRRGEWSDVVYVGDYVNDKYPDDKGTYFYAPRARISLTPKATEKLYDMGYRKAKPVVVYPSVNNRLAVCQGVLCPTVYNINQRNNNSPYTMSSWFYREMHSKLWQNTGTQNKHNYNIYNDINDYVKASNRVISTIGGHFGNGRN